MTAVEIATMMPNPANEKVTVMFSLASPAPVTVEILDLNGQRVEAPVLEQVYPAGQHNLVIDTDMFATGRYTLSIRTPDGVSVRSLLIVH